jgi:SnoaL-like domain
MDERAAREVMEQYLFEPDPDVAHEVYHEDAVLEFPQSGERFEGVDNFKEWRKQYPAEVEFELRRFRGGDDVWAAEVRARYDGGPWNYGVSILEFRGNRVAHEAIYYCEPFDAPEWRAEWRAAD